MGGSTGSWTHLIAAADAVLHRFWCRQLAGRSGGRRGRPSLPGPGPGGNRQACPTPLGHAVLEAACRAATPAEGRDGLGREQAERSPAVGDNLDGGVELVEPRLEVLQGERDRTGDMPRCVLLGRPHVDHDHVAGTGPLEKPGTRSALLASAPLERRI